MSYRETLNFLFINHGNQSQSTPLNNNFMPPNLAKKLIVVEYSKEELHQAHKFDALLLIDVQKEFCDINDRRGNEDTESTCKHIASLVPQFRSAGLPIYSIFFSREKKAPQQVDFHHYKYNHKDIAVRKTHNSAFQGDGDNIEEILSKANHKKLLVMGFNASACVYSTVSDAAKKGLDIWIVPDCVGNDNFNSSTVIGALKEMSDDLKINFIESFNALERVKTTKAQFAPKAI